MTPISLPDDRRLDPILVRVLGRVDAVARSRGEAYLLTGAMARELLLVHVHGLPPGRATRDVDFGIQVRDWAEFNTFRSTLVEGGDFSGDESIPHRVYTVPERLGLRMPVDIVPFGPIEAPAGTIHWPPKGETVMDVRGFEVGLNSAMHVEVEPGLVVLIPRGEAMVLMKALAWKDRGATTHGRDAIDLVELLERGEDLIGLDVLYEAHLEVVERHGGDPRLAGAEVLGMWAQQGLPGGMRAEVASILTQGLNANFVVQVLAGRGGSGRADRYDAVEALVRAFLRGLGSSQG